jgi:hypothetical protein
MMVGSCGMEPPARIIRGLRLRTGIAHRGGKAVTIVWFYHLEAPAFRPGRLICHPSADFSPLGAGTRFTTITRMRGGSGLKATSKANAINGGASV